MVAKLISSLFLRVPVEALARLGTVRLVAPHAMESRVIAADDALQELVCRLVEVHGYGRTVEEPVRSEVIRRRTTDPRVDEEEGKHKSTSVVQRKF